MYSITVYSSKVIFHSISLELIIALLPALSFELCLENMTLILDCLATFILLDDGRTLAVEKALCHPSSALLVLGKSISIL